jgi:gas vesicle protein
MPANEKFIQSIIELLDKMIKNQTRGSSLLTEIKNANSDIKSEISEILRQIRERLPEEIENRFEDYNKKTENVFSHVESAQSRLEEQVYQFEKSRSEIEVLIKNTIAQSLIHKTSIEKIEAAIKLQEEERQENLKVVKEVYSFMLSLKSKKAWFGFITAAIIGLAGIASSVGTAAEAIIKHLYPPKTSNNQITNPVKP